ncbi:MAG: hypothetical protein IPP17_28590 [Bacteroidetes bacterium]|nr:hypothetical protein [Bacteroidota bacterium]
MERTFTDLQRLPTAQRQECEQRYAHSLQTLRTGKGKMKEYLTMLAEV